MRILFAGAVVFLAVWFTLLRPKSDAAPAVTATTTSTPAAGNVNTGEPAVSGAGKIVEKAKSAATAAEGAAKAAAGESTDSTKTTPGAATTSAPDSKPATPAVQIPAATLAELPKDVAGALTARKVLVLAVLSDDAKHWRPMADDDRYVRNTLKKVNRYDGQVLVKQVPLSGLTTYGPLVNDLKVNQTPSVVVVDRDLKANVLEGYVDRISINQAIADARAASTDPMITDPYLRKANEICAKTNVAANRWSMPTVPGRKAWIASSRRLQAVVRGDRHAIASLAAPARFRAFKRQWMRALGTWGTKVDDVLAKVRANKFTAAEASLIAWDPTDARKLDHRFDELGLTSCSVLRRS
jgi:hypothetical protein